MRFIFEILFPWRKPRFDSGMLDVDGEGQADIRLEFKPKVVTAEFLGDPCPHPTCDPSFESLEVQRIRFDSGHDGIQISWCVSGPRRIYWEASR